MAIVSGPEAMSYAMLRRLYTDEGTLFSDPNAVTLNLTRYVSKGVRPGDIPELRSKITAAILDDERVQSVSVEIDFNFTSTSVGSKPNARTLLVHLRGVGAFGPFSLTLEASAVTVQLIRS